MSHYPKHRTKPWKTKNGRVVKQKRRRVSFTMDEINEHVDQIIELSIKERAREKS